MPFRLNLASTLLLAMIGASAFATPPKQPAPGATPGKGGGPTAIGEQMGSIKDRNSMALRGGVSESMWLEALHRLTRVPEPRRTQVTALVRTYIEQASLWRREQVPRIRALLAEVRVHRARETPVPEELMAKVQGIRRQMPRLSDLQASVWEVLNSAENSRLSDEVRLIRREGLPRDVASGRRLPGRPVVEETPPATDSEVEGASPPARPDTPPSDSGTGEDGAVKAGDEARDEGEDGVDPPLWSFVDDPNAGQPLPKRATEETEASADAGSR